MTKSLTENLIELAQLDIDAVHAYNEALKNISHQSIHLQIGRYRDDHIRHVKELSQVIIQLGGTPPDWSQDFKGYLIEGFTSLRSVTGTEGALKAMKSNEMLTNKNYEAALKWDMTEEIRRLIQNNYDDEKRHLAYIENAIENKIWEKEEANIQ